MTLSSSSGKAFAFAAVVLGFIMIGPAANAGPLSPSRLAASDAAALSGHVVQDVRHRRWRSRGYYGSYYGPRIYVGPRYYGYDYYPGDYYYAPRRSYYYYDGYYDRPYRRHSRAWVRERFEHPLGRR